ncbi:hypothetical protein BDV24DRAFT_168170 [Aspergillus arachidicola]|uniref:Uncharacterized protein n=1 Tax=Aspergillus arachidicola TaxID=656916 RepID=A0A5N6XWK5_9EURO|nr:hypothetical protein BDV24DRAFT_168170 [Aspergillus arachidicola]
MTCVPALRRHSHPYLFFHPADADSLALVVLSLEQVVIHVDEHSWEVPEHVYSMNRWNLLGARYISADPSATSRLKKASSMPILLHTPQGPALDTWAHETAITPRNLCLLRRPDFAAVIDVSLTGWRNRHLALLWPWRRISTRTATCDGLGVITSPWLY